MKRKQIIKIIFLFLQNIKFFACQGLPLRNHEEADSSFLQLFLLRGLDFRYDRALDEVDFSPLRLINVVMYPLKSLQYVLGK